MVLRSPASLLLRWARKSVWVSEKNILRLELCECWRVRTLLKLPNPVDWYAVEVTIDTSIDQRDLLLHGHGRVLLLPFAILDSKG